MKKLNLNLIKSLLVIVSVASVSIGTLSASNKRKVDEQKTPTRTIEVNSSSTQNDINNLDNLTYSIDGNNHKFTFTKKVNLNLSEVQPISELYNGNDEVEFTYEYYGDYNTFLIELETTSNNEKLTDQITATPFTNDDGAIDFSYDFDGEKVTGSEILSISQIYQIG